MTEITRDMLEGLEKPKDRIIESFGELSVGIDHFEMKNGLLTPVRSNFNARIGKALSPFQYFKPDVSKGDLLNPEVEWEDKMRKGYQVVGRVNDSARMDNHMDAIRDALIMAVQEPNGKWGTRYFPEGNIPKDTWEEGNALLDG